MMRLPAMHATCGDICPKADYWHGKVRCNKPYGHAGEHEHRGDVWKSQWFRNGKDFYFHGEGNLPTPAWNLQRSGGFVA